MRKILSSFLAIILLSPSLVSGQLVRFTTGVPVDAESFTIKIIEAINNALVPLVFAIAFIVFIWGVFRYFIYGADNEEERGKGKKLIVYGLIGFFVMVSVWGLVNVLIGSFGFNTVSPTIPDSIDISKKLR